MLSGLVHNGLEGRGHFQHGVQARMLPGVTVRPIEDMAGDAHFSELFCDKVLCPADALIGEEGQGWAQVNAELAFERSGPSGCIPA